MKYKFMRILGLLIAFASISACNVSPNKQKASNHLETNQVNKIVDVSLQEFIDPNRNSLATPFFDTLTKSEISSLRIFLNDLPHFPANSYSGCHARAHFDFIRLANRFPSKLFKVWLLSGALISPAIAGSISYTSPTGITTSWDYHVALGFVDESKNDWIIDRLISPDPIPLNDWYTRFRVTGFAIHTRTPGDLYLFNKSVVPPLDPINHPNGLLSYFVPKNTFNGTFYRYEGLAAQKHWGAEDLAADELSAALLKGGFPGCKWKEIASQTITLKAEISRGNTPTECLSAKQLFEKELRTWISNGL